MSRGSCLLRRSQESSRCLLLVPPGSAPSRLVGAFYLLTTCRTNRAPVATPGSSCSVCRKARVSLQSKRTLIWTNTAVARDFERKQRGSRQGRFLGLEWGNRGAAQECAVWAPHPEFTQRVKDSGAGLKPCDTWVPMETVLPNGGEGHLAPGSIQSRFF